MNWGSWLDEYDREARLVPALFVLLPLVLAVVGLGFDDNALLVTVFGVVFTFGGPIVAAKEVANRGRKLEEDLYSHWRGSPTTLLLVPPADRAVGEILKQRRTKLDQMTGVTLPTATTLTPDDAETYQAAVRWLITNTRDHARFPVIWTELKSYGFERNLLAVRNVGLICSTISAAALAGGLIAGSLGADIASLPAGILCGACILIGTAWWAGPSEQRVRVVADRYAERLLDSTAAL